MDNFQKLVQAVQALEVDFQKFYDRGQSAAGTRLRKGLSELKKLSQEVRNGIQKVKEERKAPKA